MRVPFRKGYVEERVVSSWTEVLGNLEVQARGRSLSGSRLEMTGRGPVGPLRTRQEQMSSSMAEFDSTWDQVFTKLTGVAEEMFGSPDQLRKVLACCSEEDPEGLAQVKAALDQGQSVVQRLPGQHVLGVGIYESSYSFGALEVTLQDMAYTAFELRESGSAGCCVGILSENPSDTLELHVPYRYIHATKSITKPPRRGPEKVTLTLKKRTCLVPYELVNVFCQPDLTSRRSWDECYVGYEQSEVPGPAPEEEDRDTSLLTKLFCWVLEGRQVDDIDPREEDFGVTICAYPSFDEWTSQITPTYEDGIGLSTLSDAGDDDDE